MALDAEALETALKDRIKTELDSALEPAPSEGDDHRKDFSDALAKAISDEVVKHIKDTLVITGATVKIPASAVIISVSGGTGAPAVGVPNPTPIDCEINLNDDPARLD